MMVKKMVVMMMVAFEITLQGFYQRFSPVTSWDTLNRYIGNAWWASLDSIHFLHLPRPLKGIAHKGAPGKDPWIITRPELPVLAGVFVTDLGPGPGE